MFSRVVFVCLIANFTLISCLSVDTSAGSSAPLQSQGAVPASPDSPQVITLQKKIEQLEEKQESLMDEIVLLRATRQKTDTEHLVKQKRKRRSASDLGGMAQLPNDECIPGTNGCPVALTSYSLGGSCMLCPAGSRGDPGPVGPPGRDGRDAIALLTSSGNPVLGGGGAPCRPDVNPARNISGAVYIRWGHHSCPSSSALIYSGSAAGSSHHSTGNGANQLCLPIDPAYDDPVAGVGTTRSFLYTLEYQISDFPKRNDRLLHDVPCAVCKAPDRVAHLMIPGKNTCPSDDWTLEYGGYLMAERSSSTHQRSLFICVDGEMQTLPRTSGGARDSSRALINLVEARCSSGGGGIPCGPYIDGYELTCAVCTL